MSILAGPPGRIVLVGGGNMGGALLRGWVDAGLAGDIHLVDPSPHPSLMPWIAEGRIGHSATVPPEPAEIVVLAVKPQMMGEALGALAPMLCHDTLILSVAAGTTIAMIEARVGARPIVRAMPNTPALIGRGITGCVARPDVSAALRDRAEGLLSAGGPVVWLAEEAEIDAVTAVSGSGPAYLFLLAETLAAAGEALGLSPALAMTLARHTLAGAGELMIRSEEPPATLRRNVTSPKGTTEAALTVLTGPDGLGPLMERAVTAARDRARELSRG